MYPNGHSFFNLKKKNEKQVFWQLYFQSFLSNEKTCINAVQFSIFNYKLRNENWNASCRDRVNRSLIKDDRNWLTLNLQWIQAAAHKKMSIYMLLNKPCMLLNKPYKFHWSKERLIWEIIWEIWMSTNRLIFTLVTLGREWIKLWEWAKWPRKGSPLYLRSVRFCWFVTFGLKNLSVNIK